MHSDICPKIKCGNSRSTGTLSENVLVQNLATLKNELLGVHSFQHILDYVDPSAYDSLNNMIEDIRKQFQTLIKSHGLVDAVQIYVNRKLDKVARYVKQ